MQTPATVPAPAVKPPQLHVRVARSTQAAPQPGVAPENFKSLLAQAQVTPGSAAPAQAAAPSSGKAPLLPTAEPAPAPGAAAAAPAQNTTKAQSSAPAQPDATAEPDKAPVVADEAAKSTQPPAQPPVALPAPLPAAVPVGLMPTPAAEQEAATPIETSIPAADASPIVSLAEGSQGAPAIPQPALPVPVRPAAAGAVPQSGPDRTSAGAEHEATAPTLESELTALAASNVDLPVPVLSSLAMSPPHLNTAPPVSTVRASAAAEPSSPSPAEQVGPPLASFAVSAAQPGAAQHLTIQLAPTELGRVQVHIERLPGGPARVELLIERPDTLLMLLRDQPQLHRALDLAGVPAAERSLQFQLTPSTAGPNTTASPFNADAEPGQQRPGQPRQQGSTNGNMSLPDDPTIPSSDAFRRAGVNIMA